MNIFEVGLICDCEGGHGFTVGTEEDKLPLSFAKRVLNFDINQKKRSWVDAVGLDPYWQEYVDDYNKAANEVDAAKTIDELKEIKVEAAMLSVRISRCAVKTEEDFKNEVG